ncbi:ZYRO0C06996p [Zygosaccharomyces rouxii]|uniref:ZYRO0C06996p n=1 Tax=Zygosaccharomyces rouxii (strain ATCC 2623 / CBS 732 / NBRC 1130 / NCYC 568 / NRRL Y-229) TaxID=559307 RepID=C5DTB0_ZYGRC|nr:uncharacterized protein ZYRO0C06996g [Zygosaccharomyces rouxii]KAH9201799.1 Rec10/Red1 [Zygosaccharomyces rouxii]CAR27021.1 ZYRO0C06996p [Zygosaccharomyces rouxii]
MFGYGEEAEAIASQLFGGTLEDDKIEEAIKKCKTEKSNATRLLSLIELMTEESCENLQVLYAVLRMCLKFLDARLIDQSFAFALMVHCKLLSFLLEEGLNVNNRGSWKYLALLLRIMYGVPGSKKALIRIVREEFNSRIGFVLDHLRDFQLGNYIIELLSDCFPRKHNDKPGVVMAPILWPQEPEKNEIIFGSLEYPFRGKHGYVQVTNFVWQKYGTQLENVLRVSNISYGTNVGSSSGIKRFNSGKNSKHQEHCYIQATCDCMYLWDGEGLFLELDRRYVDVVKTLKGCIRINVKDANCIKSPDRTWLKVFQRTKWFQLQSEDKNACEQFYANITSYRKVSEVQTFLLLNHVDEDEQETARSTQDVSHKAQSENSQLATPDHSDPKIRTDEWDINLSSELQGTREGSRAKITPEHTDENNFPLAAEVIEHEEQSPLVLAQKRKMIRETSRTLELLRKEFAQETNAQNATIEEIENCAVAERSPSLIITRFENKNSSNDKTEETSAKGKSLKPPQPLPPSLNKNVKSIGKKDINVLDTIFGTPPSNKKKKRQRELNNFRPVIDVPSQDIPKVQTRSNKKKGKPLITAKNSSPPKAKDDSDPSKPEKKKKQQMHPPKAPPLKKAKPTPETAKEPEPPTQIQTQKESPTHIPAEEVALASAAIPNQVPPVAIDTSLMSSNVDKSNMSFDSTTVVAPSSNRTPFGINSAFTDKLQEQIYGSITLFSNELLRKMTIINKELNVKIVKELSEKYQNLFQELQASFRNDTEEMSNFVGEIKDMLNLPEEQLVQFIRTRKFGSQS